MKRCQGLSPVSGRRAKVCSRRAKNLDLRRKWKAKKFGEKNLLSTWYETGMPVCMGRYLYGLSGVVLVTWSWNKELGHVQEFKDGHSCALAISAINKLSVGMSTGRAVQRIWFWMIDGWESIGRIVRINPWIITNEMLASSTKVVARCKAINRLSGLDIY